MRHTDPGTDEELHMPQAKSVKGRDLRAKEPNARLKRMCMYCHPRKGANDSDVDVDDNPPHFQTGMRREALHSLQVA